MAEKKVPDIGGRGRWGLFGAIMAAAAASVCCLGPLVLLALGVSGAWIGSLSAVSAYRPIFIGLAFVALGYAFYSVYRRPKATECEPGAVCAMPASSKFYKVTLWIVAVLTIGLVAFPYVLPVAPKAMQTEETHAQRAVLSVEGMTCSGCVFKVRSSLERLDGVIRADVSLKPPLAVIEHHPEKVSVEDLIRATTEAGYPSKLSPVARKGGPDETE